MKIFQKISRFLGAALIFAALFASNAAPVFAEDEKIPQYRLQISPAKIDIGDLEPGESYSDIIKVQNTGQNAFDFKMSVVPFSVKDENYTQAYESKEKYNDIVNWVKFSTTTGHLEPNTQEEVAYTVTVPADVPAGGQYAILMAEIANNDEVSEDSGVTMLRRVGTLLYSNVAGTTRRTGEVIENKVPSILFNPPVSATSIVSNTGNTHTDATYVLQVYPLFGDEEVYTNEEKPTTLTILPDTRRLNTITWDGAPHLGIFRVKQTVTIFDQTSTTEKLVFLCPIWFIFIVLLIIFCAIFWIVSRIRNRKER